MMKRFRRADRRRLPLWPLLLALSIAVVPMTATALPAPVRAESAVPETADRAALERHVAEWVGALAAEKPFAAWKKASPRIDTLGPGTHGWLVTLVADGRAAGYLVVYAAEDGTYRLGEYGLGPQPLFDTGALRRALFANGWIDSTQSNEFQAVKHYAHAFAAAWEVRLPGQTVWLDAKTGEQLPLDAASWAEAAKASALSAPFAAPATSKIGALKLNATFDPYERLPWLMDEAPFAADPAKLLQRLASKGHLRFVSEPFGDAMLYALPVTGYQRWADGRTDLALDMAGTRFIPLETLTKLGLFYR
ncbi:hypothetical protein [Cohnella sp. REN36]|uniref:hypothetical protein n=1 Tax=Cohnella sp. REN36 TaxID=2887347 RepID=UPI001D14C7CD|nr:hypothetical protein [Cohnella sp. REN36]MCC3374337.1 hypothetical protein [Cohnella sp. REN36]